MFREQSNAGKLNKPDEISAVFIGEGARRERKSVRGGREREGRNSCGREDCRLSTTQAAK